MQVAADLLDEYVDGVWLVELAPLADPDLVPRTVAAALGLLETPGRPLTETLTDYLKPRALLLVLDNCEHLVAACAHLTESLLRSCPRLRILATSREALGIVGETAWRVPSLEALDPGRLPSQGVALMSALAESEAVRLFVERARAAQPDFALTGQNAAAVAQICRRLDGMPLAIELAAARVKLLSPEQIAGRLDDRFRLLTGGSRTALPRQQTLRAAIDWSYDLLAGDERALLRRLSVFAGGWTLEAAEAVCAFGARDRGWGIGDRVPVGDESLSPIPQPLSPADVLELLGHLVDKSLVLVEEGIEGETRYRLLETVRQYAQERLMEAGEAAATRARHRDWFLALAEEAEPNLRGIDALAWLNRLETKHDNLRSALAWSQADADHADAWPRLAGALSYFWYARRHFSEG